MTAVALALGLLVAGGAAAATDVLPVGSVIPGGEPSGAPEHRLSVPETVIATGSSPVGGQWQLTSFHSEGTVDNGEVVEPAGLPCIRLLLTAAPTGTPTDGSGFCGNVDGNFAVAGVPVRDDASSRGEVLLFGPAPEEAAAVELTADDGSRLRAQTQDGPADFDGDAWVLAAPVDLKHAEVTWIGEDGKTVGPKRDASSPFARAAALEPAG